MATIYAHLKPNNRMLSWATTRKTEIAERIDQLKQEDELMDLVISRFKSLVCSNCGGSGNVMLYEEGNHEDGRRQHLCKKCNGSGHPQNTASET